MKGQRLKTWLSVLIVLAAVFAAQRHGASSQTALPVFPGAEGFGVTTRAGRGGQVIKVTNLNATGPGSLRAALGTPGPRTIIFEVGGVIDLTATPTPEDPLLLDSELYIKEPLVTVAGQTAPSPGITVIGAGIAVQTHDVLIQHIRVRVGDRALGPLKDNRDAIRIDEGPDSYNVVIDKCSFSWSTDEVASVWTPGTNNVTLTDCILAEGLSIAGHYDVEHSKGLIIGDDCKQVSVIRNLFAHNRNRNPFFVGGSETATINNLVYNPNNLAIHAGNPNGTPGGAADIIGNHVIFGYNTGRDLVTGEDSGDIPSVVLERPNPMAYLGAPPYHNLPEVTEERAPLDMRLSASAVPVPHVTIRTTDRVKDYVLRYAGARSADRDEHDRRVVADVVNGTGRMINSQDEVGGFPNPTPTYRALTVPADPHGDGDGDGYTNLEEWLHSFYAEVEHPKPTEPVVQILDDNDPAVEYQVGWQRRGDAAASGGGYHRRLGNAGGAEPTARLVFTGGEVTYFYSVSNQGGSADVFVDGALKTTVSYYDPQAGGASRPSHGRAVSFTNLGDARHELVIKHRSGAVYVDGFRVASGGGDAAAVRYTTESRTESALLSGTLIRTVEVRPGDSALSVVVEGAGEPPTVSLLNPYGAVVSTGGALLSGVSISGIDAFNLGPGLYTVKAVALPGQSQPVDFSVIYTKRAP